MAGETAYTVTKDAGINNANPDTNYGTANENWAGWDGGGAANRMFLGWGTVIPAGEYFVYGNLWGYCSGWPMYLNDGVAIRLINLPSSWGEYTVTWNNQSVGSFLASRTIDESPLGVDNIYDIPDNIGAYLNNGIAIIEETGGGLAKFRTREISMGFRLVVWTTVPTVMSSASYIQDTTTMRVYWDSRSSYDYFNHYEVYMSYDGSSYSLVYDSVTATYKDCTQTNGTKAWYKVKVDYYSHGTHKKNDLSAISAVTGIAAKRPQNPVATAGNREATITWTDMAEAAHYHIYHSTNGSSYTKLGTEPTGGSYNHTGITAGTHYYKITAYYTDAYHSTESAYSNVVSCVVTCNPPSSLTATGGNREANLAWSACSPVPTNYYVYRSPDGYSYAQVGTTPGATLTSGDSNLKSGTYYYKIKAHYTDEDSGYSAADDAISTCIPPTNFKAYTSSGDALGLIRIGSASGTFAATGDWSQCSPTPSYYKVYRSGLPDSGYAYIGSGGTPAGQRRYADNNLPNGVFYYKLTAVYSDEESTQSSYTYETVTDSTENYIEFTEGYCYINGELIYMPSGTCVYASQFTEGSGSYHIYVKPNTELDNYYGSNFTFRITKSATPASNELDIYTCDFVTNIISNGLNVNRDYNVVSNVGTSSKPFYTGGSIFFAVPLVTSSADQGLELLDAGSQTIGLRSSGSSTTGIRLGNAGLAILNVATDGTMSHRVNNSEVFNAHVNGIQFTGGKKTIAAAAGYDMVLKMGDTSGAKAVQFNNSDSTTVASIDSYGTFTGLVPSTSIKHEAWTAYDVDWVAVGCTPTSLGTNTGAYIQIGHTVHFWAKWVSSGACTGMTAMYCSLPVNISTEYTENAPIGLAHIYDVSTNWFMGSIHKTSYGTGQAYARVHVCKTDSTYATILNLAAAVPMTWANGDSIMVTGTYTCA